MPGALRSPLFRASVAVATAVFAAGAAVSLRLHLRMQASVDWAAVGSQGIEVMAWFTLFAVPAVWAAASLTRSWPAFAGRRILVGVVAYAIAFTMFVLAFALVDAHIGEDRIANAYLAVGSLAGALAWQPIKTPPKPATPTVIPA